MTEQAIRTSKTAIKAPPYAWVILGIVFLASVAAPLNQFKVPPLMPVLIRAFNLSIANSGWLMSVFSLTGIILAIPAGFIMQKYGPKTTGLISVGCVAIGAVLGAVSTSAGLMLLSRFIEGVGMGLIAVVAPVAIATWFPAETRGVPMGIWAIWVPAGSIIMFNLAPALNAAMGWQAVWWAGAIFSGIAFALYMFLFRLPRPEEMAGGPPPREAGPAEKPDLGKAMANRDLWLLSFTFMCFNLALQALNTYYPTFLNAERGYDLGAASFIASLAAIVNIVSSPAGGYISDRIGSRRRMIIIPFSILMFGFLFLFTAGGALIPALMIAMGILIGAVPTATFAAVPEVMGGPQLAGIGMAVLALGQNLGMVIGPAVFGPLASSIGWANAGYLLIPVCIAGIIAAWFVKVR